MVLMIKELTQQAQATTASRMLTRGVAQAMAMVPGSHENRSLPGGLVREGREVHPFIAL